MFCCQRCSRRCAVSATAPSRLWRTAWLSRRGRSWSRRCRSLRPPQSLPPKLGRAPPFAHDGTERRIPQNPAEQTQCYSGKKKDHTVKNILLVNAVLIILFLSDTVGGRIHDKRLAEPYPLPAGSRLLEEIGFLAFTLPQVEILMPTRKPPGAELSPAPACCMEEAEAREPPSPAVDQATRTESGRSSIW